MYRYVITELDMNHKAVTNVFVKKFPNDKSASHYCKQLCWVGFSYLFQRCKT